MGRKRTYADTPKITTGINLHPRIILEIDRAATRSGMSRSRIAEICLAAEYAPDLVPVGSVNAVKRQLKAAA